MNAKSMSKKARPDVDRSLRMEKMKRLILALTALAAVSIGAAADRTADAPNRENTSSKKAEAIPWDQIRAKAGPDYKGDGLSVATTVSGARLHCVA